MDISEAFEYINSYKNDYPHKDLSRVRELLTKLGDPDRKLRFVHVAGTNGTKSLCLPCWLIPQRISDLSTKLFPSP